MMFCKEDMQSIKILNQRVELFSLSSGLVSNNTKSGIYLVGVNDNIRAYAANTLDYEFECLPVKYLCMPLTSKWYTTADCE